MQEETRSMSKEQSEIWRRKAQEAWKKPSVDDCVGTIYLTILVPIQGVVQIFKGEYNAVTREPPPFDECVMRTTQDFPELGIKLSMLDDPAKDSQVLAAAEEFANEINTDKFWEVSESAERAILAKYLDVLQQYASRTDDWEFYRCICGYLGDLDKKDPMWRLNFMDKNPWSNLYNELKSKEAAQ